MGREEIQSAKTRKRTVVPTSDDSGDVKKKEKWSSRRDAFGYLGTSTSSGCDTTVDTHMPRTCPAGTVVS